MYFDIGVRKYVEAKLPQYWLIIAAKGVEPEEISKAFDEKFTTSKIPITCDFINNGYWKFFVMLIIFVNTIITINFLFQQENWGFYELSIAVLIADVVIWVDVLSAIAQKVRTKKLHIAAHTRHTKALIVDGISLLPISALYLGCAPHPTSRIFWPLRFITILRIYRIPSCFLEMSTSDSRHWIGFLSAYALYAILVIEIWAGYMFNHLKRNHTLYNNFENYIFSQYFSITTFFNIGFGDILPDRDFERAACALEMVLGCTLKGVLTGALATEFANKEKQREIYRHQYNDVMNSLKERKIDKKLMDKTSESLVILWKYKKGHMGTPPVYILPVSLQKEIFFDVNFEFLNRSLIFSNQPRSFLRSVALQMRNKSYLPGEIIMEPFGMVDTMFCILSGVIEILSEENDDTPLFSLTHGSILGESTLFIPVPIRCVIRATTFVELQVLMKIQMSRMALRYPEIYRSMRATVLLRFKFHDEFESNAEIKSLDSDFYQLVRRKATKRFLEGQKNEKKEIDKIGGKDPTKKESVKSLYVLSENIPRVKTIPMNVIRSKPWILRPNTPLLTLWEYFMNAIIVSVILVIPYLAGFIRKITAEVYVYLSLVKILYIIDLCIQCITAVERKDHFTYITSIKEIVWYKLKTLGFYFDILATYNLDVYAFIIGPYQTEYGVLLFSLNRVLKVWHIFHFFITLENTMGLNLLFIRAIKYFFFIIVSTLWAAVFYYLEACFKETCYEDRWFAVTQQKEIKSLDPTPCTGWPTLMALYWGSITVTGLGYGDIIVYSIYDCISVLIVTIMGATFCVIFISQASSTFKHLTRARSQYQEEIFAVVRFLKDHNISHSLQKRVQNYFRLQWDFDRAFTLKHLMFPEDLPALQRQLIQSKVIKNFLTVPLFQGAGDDFLKALAKSCKIKVLPPNEVIVESGTFYREMYILENGYCEVSSGEGENKEIKIISPVNPFGYVEMISGSPLEVTVKTLTHVRIISLDYSSYLITITKFPTMKPEIEDKVESENAALGDSKFRTFGFKPFQESEADRIAIQKHKEIVSKSFINVHKYQKRSNQNYWEPFQEWGRFRFLQFLVLPISIVPYGLFLKVWMCIRIVLVLAQAVVVPVHYSLTNYMFVLGHIVSFLQIVAWVDMYIMFHVAYYDKRGILMFHPSKTAIGYLKGNFILDLLTSFPYQSCIVLLFPRTSDIPSILHDGPGLILVFQIYKFFQGCHYLESDIISRTEVIKVLKLIPMALIIGNVVTGMMILLQCCRTSEFHYPNEKELNLESMYIKQLEVVCSGKKPLNSNFSVTKLYSTTYYWVISTMTTCGFGDLTAQDEITLGAVIVILLLGVFVFGYMFSSLTSGMISAHSQIMIYRRRILDLNKFVRHKNIGSKLERRLIMHYEYNWQRTENANPQKMLIYIPAALRQSIVANMYEETVSRIPVFAGVEKTIIRILGKHLNEIYFLQGETIVKYKDIQEYIYLIYRGSVDVFSQDGTQLSTMRAGGMFGNINKKPFSLSSILVIAAKNCDVLRLETEVFFRALQVFPNTKSVYDSLILLQNDYMEPLQTRSDTLSDIQIELFQVDKIPYEITVMKRDLDKFNFSGINLTARVSYFHLRNSVFKAPQKPCYTFVILPRSFLDEVLQSVGCLAAFISSMLTIYVFGFQDFSIPVFVTSYLLDMLFIVKVFLVFNYAYTDSYGDVVVNRKTIAKRYFHAKKEIAVDIIANTPLEIFSVFAPSEFMLPVLSILRLNRLFRVCYVLMFYDNKFKILMLNKIYLQVSKVTGCIIFMIHFFTCTWYFADCPIGKCQAPSWLTELKWVEGSQKARLYFLSVYYIVSVGTTTGYGDIPVFSVQAMLICCMYLIVSQFGLVLLSGSMGSVVNVKNLALYQHHEKITALKESFKKQNASKYQIDKILNYVTSLWQHSRGKEIPKMITQAPYTIRCEVMYEMYGSHLSESYIFSQMDEAFLRQLAIYLKRTIYFPENYIVQQGDIDQTMYFIHTGKVSVLTIHPNLMETVHFTLVENDNFGMVQGLIMEKAHHFSYRADNIVEILSLTWHHWNRLLKFFPNASQKIYKKLQTLPKPGTQAKLT